IFFWIVVAFFAGCMLGIYNPSLAVSMEPLGTNFIKLIKAFIAPIVFLTVATGIAQTGSLKKLGAIGLKAFIYFEVVSTIALLFGWSAAVLIKPGAMIQSSVENLDIHSVSRYLE